VIAERARSSSPDGHPRQADAAGLAQAHVSVPTKTTRTSTGWAPNTGCSDEGFESKVPPPWRISQSSTASATAARVEYDKATFLKEWLIAIFVPINSMALQAEALRSPDGAHPEHGRRRARHAAPLQRLLEAFHSTSGLHEEVKTFGNEWSGTYGYGRRARSSRATATSPSVGSQS